MCYTVFGLIETSSNKSLGSIDKPKNFKFSSAFVKLNKQHAAAYIHTDLIKILFYSLYSVNRYFKFKFPILFQIGVGLHEYLEYTW